MASVEGAATLDSASGDSDSSATAPEVKVMAAVAEEGDDKSEAADDGSARSGDETNAEVRHTRTVYVLVRCTILIPFCCGSVLARNPHVLLQAPFFCLFAFWSFEDRFCRPPTSKAFGLRPFLLPSADQAR